MLRCASARLARGLAVEIAQPPLETENLSQSLDVAAGERQLAEAGAGRSVSVTPVRRGVQALAGPIRLQGSVFRPSVIR